MSKNEMSLLVLFLMLIVTSILLTYSDFSKYFLLSLSSALIVLIVMVKACVERINKVSKYDKKVNYILRTYHSLLTEINGIPTMIRKEIYHMESFEDLLDIQAIANKTIYYKKDTDKIVFYLVDDNNTFNYYVMEDELKSLKMKSEEYENETI